MRYFDITQQRFGKLIAQSVAGCDKHGNMRWHCLCDCGRHVVVTGTNLRQGRKKSCGRCGNLRIIDLTGKHFGRLVVIKPAEKRSVNGNMRWHCRCDCGRYVIVDGQRLRRNLTQSCGCLRRELMRRRANKNAAFRKAQGNINSLKDSHGVFICSKRRSKRNHTGVIGVSYDRCGGYYVARLRYHGHYVLNKTTPTFQRAVALRRQAELKYFGQSNQ